MPCVLGSRPTVCGIRAWEYLSRSYIFFFLLLLNCVWYSFLLALCKNIIVLWCCFGFDHCTMDSDRRLYSNVPYEKKSVDAAHACHMFVHVNHCCCYFLFLLHTLTQWWWRNESRKEEKWNILTTQINRNITNYSMSIHRKLFCCNFTNWIQMKWSGKYSLMKHAKSQHSITLYCTWQNVIKRRICWSVNIHLLHRNANKCIRNYLIQNVVDVTFTAVCHHVMLVHQQPLRKWNTHEMFAEHRT